MAFTIPNDKLRVRMHNVIMGDVYLLDLLQFSEDVLNAVGGWWESAKDTEPVADNAKDMLRVRIGLPGFIEGLPLLA